MKKNQLILFFYVLLISSYTSNGFKREDFFKNITGMTENEFRQRYNWDANHYIDDSPNIRRELCKKNDRSAAIFQGDFKFWPLADVNMLANTIRETRQAHPTKQQSKFCIILYNPAEPEKSDIRYLQSDLNNNGAFFQIASTFWGPLEGGMFKWDSSITDMLKHPVQGEEAAISAAPATIWRKYFMPAELKNKGLNQNQYISEFYLLRNIEDKIPWNWGFFGPKIDIDNIASNFNPTSQSELQRIAVGLHRNIAVSSGIGKKAPSDEQKEVRINVKILPDETCIVDTDRSQLISQIFTAATNLQDVLYKREKVQGGRAKRRFLGKTPDQLKQNIIDMSKLLLNASYASTIRIAYIYDKPIFLTLVGAGAFHNPLNWISEAIKANESFLKQNPTEVYLIYHPDKPRFDDFGTPIQLRDATTDADFLRDMILFAAKINNTENKLPKLNLLYETIFNYTAAARNVAADQNNISLMQGYKIAANNLQKIIQSICPATAEAAPQPTDGLTKLSQHLDALQQELQNLKTQLNKI